MNPTIAEIDSTNDTTYANTGTTKNNTTRNAAVQILIHQLQVNRYPSFVSGEYFFQIFSRMPSKITSVVSNRVSRYEAKTKTR